MLFWKTIRYSENGFPDPKKDRILMIGYFDKKFNVLSGNEGQMIKKFLKLIKNHKRIVGYKCDYDDWPFLIERAKKYGIKIDAKITGKYFRGIILRRIIIEGIEDIDLFPIAWREFPNLLTKSISELAEAIGIKGIEEIPEYKIHEKNSRELKKYLKDYVLLIRKIYKNHILFEEKISEIVGVPLEDQIRYTVGELVDLIVKKKLKQIGRKIKSKPKRGFGYYGGYVYLKSPGIYKKIGYLDFKSMYPNIIRIWNISPETVDVKCKNNKVVEVEGVKHTICQDLRGIIPLLVDEMIKRRERIKKEMKKAKGSKRKKLDAEQHAIKVLTNAMYGYMGWDNATYYNKGAAELTSALGRFYIKQIVNLLEKDYNVIYVDTDGVQILGKNFDKAARMINKKYPLEIRVEYVADVGAYWTKKKYAHLVKGKLIVKGLEMVRRDYPEIIKRMQKELVIAMLLNKDVKKIVEKYRNKLLNKEIDISDLAIKEQMSKKPEEYEKMTKTSVVAKILQNKFGIELHHGTVLNIVIVKGKGGPTSRARPAEFTDIKDIDFDYYLKMFDDVVKRTIKIKQKSLLSYGKY